MAEPMKPPAGAIDPKLYEKLPELLKALDAFDIPRKSALDFLEKEVSGFAEGVQYQLDHKGFSDFGSDLTRIATDPLSYTQPWTRAMRGGSALKKLRAAMDKGQEAVDRLPDEVKAAALAESEDSLLPKE